MSFPVMSERDFRKCGFLKHKQGWIAPDGQVYLTTKVGNLFLLELKKG